MNCYEDLKALRIKYGTSEFDFSERKLMRERVNSDRDKRIKFPNSLYQRKFDNLRKSSKSIQQQSKESGKPFTELIRVAIEDE